MGRWAIAAVDLDGTLIRGTTACRHLGEWIGHRDVIDDLERRFAAGEIDSSAVAEGDAPYYAGKALANVADRMVSAPCIEDIQAGVALLRATGVLPLITTVTWTFAAQCFANLFGFAAVSGCVMGVDEVGVLSGKVLQHFEPADKVRFVERYCHELGVTTRDVVAIGDGRSDIPLFEVAGFSVALNASAEARACASVAVDSNSFLDALSAVPGL
jgi:phosphoserine phosphatase